MLEKFEKREAESEKELASRPVTLVESRSLARNLYKSCHLCLVDHSARLHCRLPNGADKRRKWSACSFPRSQPMSERSKLHGEQAMLPWS